MVDRHRRGYDGIVNATATRHSVSGAMASLLVLLVALATGCETIPPQEFSRLRADVNYIRRNIITLKEEMTGGRPETSDQLSSIQRTQADLNEKATELGTDLQVTQAKVEEARYEIAQLSRKIESLELSLTGQIKGLRTSRPAEAGFQQSGRGRPQAGSPPSDEALSKFLASPAAMKGLITPPSELQEQVPAVLSTQARPVSRRPSEGVAETPTTASVTPSHEMPAADHVQVYETAYEDYSKGNFELARRAFSEYLRLFPNTDLADNAQYWIGECYFSQEDYQRAAEEFGKVLENYSEGNKVPISMLKMGYSLLQMGDQGKATQLFNELIGQFPLSSEADLARTKLRTL